MNKEFLEALDELEREKNIPKEEIISAIETAVKTAYEKNFGGNTMVEVDRETGEVQVFLIKDVVAEVDCCPEGERGRETEHVFQTEGQTGNPGIRKN